MRLIDSCITQLKAQGPSRTCNESKEEEEEGRRRTEEVRAKHHVEALLPYPALSGGKRREGVGPEVEPARGDDFGEDRIGTGPPRARTEVIYVDLGYWAISAALVGNKLISIQNFGGLEK